MTTITDKSLIKFIVRLDQIYQGLESYLDINEMPGTLITSVLVKTHGAHIKFQHKHVIDAFNDMPFFKMSVSAKVNDISGIVWNPTTESLKGFSLRHTDKEVIYFEDKNYQKTVQFFQRELRELLSNR